MLFHYLYNFCIIFYFFLLYLIFFFNDTATTEIYTLSLHAALPISRPRIAADVVVADDRDVVRRRNEIGTLVRIGLVEHPVADRIVGEVVAQRLADAAKTFAAHRHDGVPFILRTLFFRDGLDVVADQADRAFALDRDALVQRKQLLDLVDDLVEFLVAAENDVLFLEVGGELHGHEGVDAGGADIVVTARGPGILAAANRAVTDVDHVLDRPPDDALRARIRAAAN